MADVAATLRRVLAERSHVSASELARAAGVSRQSAHAHLRRGVEAGELVREGAGRATRYRVRAVPDLPHLRYARAGLEEDRVWRDVRDLLPELEPRADAILAYAVTELVNNAIDHSAAESVELSVSFDADEIVVRVYDDGIGVFERVRRALGLDDHLHALQELHKGKLTTMPDRHTGEGIYFVSKSVDRFTLESSGLCWIVDHRIGDTAVLETEPRPGTAAEIVVARQPKRALDEVFAEYTRNFEFSRSRTVVKLFTLGVRFVSRSEAKRVLSGLEKFREVVLDFAGVEGVGQGFADEVFRVWARAHPETRLVPENMNRAVELMVRRALT